MLSNLACRSSKIGTLLLSVTLFGDYLRKNQIGGKCKDTGFETNNNFKHIFIKRDLLKIKMQRNAAGEIESRSSIIISTAKSIDIIT